MKMLLTCVLSVLCIPSMLLCSDIPSLSLQESLLQQNERPPRSSCAQKAFCIGVPTACLGLIVISVALSRSYQPSSCVALTIPHCGPQCPSPIYEASICPPPQGDHYDKGEYLDTLLALCPLQKSEKIIVSPDNNCIASGPKSTCRLFTATTEHIKTTCHRPLSATTPLRADPFTRLHKKLEDFRKKRTGHYITP